MKKNNHGSIGHCDYTTRPFTTLDQIQRISGYVFKVDGLPRTIKATEIDAWNEIVRDAKRFDLVVGGDEKPEDKLSRKQIGNLQGWVW